MNFPTKARIRDLGIKPVKKRSQNFLIDKNIAKKAVSSGQISSNDTVIEIGPGPGSLTCFLTLTGARIYCFELDNNLYKILSHALAEDLNTQVLNEDILNIDFKTYTGTEGNSVLIGSIPYAITTPILLKFLEAGSLFKKAIFIVQKELAQRLCAKPGSRDYGIFSVYCSTYLKSSILQIIPSECFFPKPGIDSAIIEMIPDKDRTWDSEDEILFRKLVRASFSNRRKTLKNCLKNFLNQKQTDPDRFKARAEEAGIDLIRRAETLSTDEFYTLTRIAKELMNP